MYFNKIISFVLATCLIFLTSCSQDIDQAQITQSKPHVATDSEFIKTYIDYTESLGAFKQELLKGKSGFENKIVKDYISNTSDPRAYENAMEKTYLLLKDKSLYEKWDVLKDLKAINKSQHQYLYDFTHAIELGVEHELSLDELTKIITFSFEKEQLHNKFKPSEVALLQLIGLDLMRSILKSNYQPGVELKTCDNFIQKFACGVATIATIAIAAILVEEAGGLSIENIEAICNILEELGIDTNFIPESYETLAEQLLGEGVPADEINCAILITVGLWDFLYQTCCSILFGDDDPCSTTICPPGTICEEGECVIPPSPCQGVECPPGTYCEDGVCLEWSCSYCPCENDDFCGDGWECVNGTCMPEG